MQPGKVRDIYLMQSMDLDAYKIGISKDCQLRRAQLMRDLAADIELIAYFPGTLHTERKLHSLLWRYRVPRRGEWYHIDPEVIDTFNAVMRKAMALWRTVDAMKTTQASVICL